MLRGIVLLAIVVIVSVTVACDPAISITFENRTSNPFRVDVLSNPSAKPIFGEVKAGSTKTYDYLSRNRDEYRVIIVDSDGTTVFDETVTTDVIKAHGSRFVIDDNGVHLGEYADDP